MSIRELRMLEANEKDGKLYANYYLVGVVEGLREASEAEQRAGQKPLFCVNGRRLEPAMARIALPDRTDTQRRQLRGRHAGATGDLRRPAQQLPLSLNRMTSASDDTTRALGRIRADVQSMHAYAVQDARGLLKLDAMENPHGLPPALQAALGERLGALALNRYPGARSADLQRALAAYAGVPEGFGLMLGNGSDELISLLAMACDLPGAAVLAPVPGFVMYAMSAQLQGLRFVGVPLTADFELDEAAMLAAIAREKPAIVYLAYPEQPDRQPVGRRRDREDRRGPGRPGRPGRDRRGLPALRRPAATSTASRATAMCC